MPLDKYFFVKSICLDVSFISSNDYITKESIEKALKKSNLEIRESDAIIFHTGHFGKRDYLKNWPGLNRETVEYLANRVVNIGIDAPSVDTPSDKDYPANTICGARDISHIENLRGLTEALEKRIYTYRPSPQNKGWYGFSCQSCRPLG